MCSTHFHFYSVPSVDEDLKTIAMYGLLLQSSVDYCNTKKHYNMMSNAWSNLITEVSGYKELLDHGVFACIQEVDSL